MGTAWEDREAEHPQLWASPGGDRDNPEPPAEDGSRYKLDLRQGMEAFHELFVPGLKMRREEAG